MTNDTRAYTITFTEKGLEQEPELDNRKQWATKLTPSSCQSVVQLQDGSLHIIEKIRQSSETKEIELQLVAVDGAQKSKVKLLLQDTTISMIHARLLGGIFRVSRCASSANGAECVRIEMKASVQNTLPPSQMGQRPRDLRPR